MYFTIPALTLGLAAIASATPYSSPKPSPVVNQTTCNGKTYVYEELAGYGFVPGDARDKFGDTIGGIGSSIALDLKAWKKHGKSWTGILWGLPDRGWNTQGTLNFQSRVHKFAFTLTPDESATVAHPSPPNLKLKYLDTIRFTGPDGVPTTGLDCTAKGAFKYPGFPDLPRAIYTGDGFGLPGPGGEGICVDAEGLILNDDGTFWVSDEYGPYIYKFSSSGKMLQAIRPPDAFIPHRNGSESFSADSPPIYNPNVTVVPSDPEDGRQNNQGFEGLTISSDGKTMSVLIQSALEQEGGMHGKKRRYARLVQYDIPSSHGYGYGYGSSKPVYKAEYVVPLPVFTDSDGDNAVAAQSEIHYISETQYLVLARDSGNGHGQSSSLSIYRHADVFDISSATDIKSIVHDKVNGSIASEEGVLDAGVTPATYCSFLDFNVNSQLNRFGLHNGGAQNAQLLNEKWESLALAPIGGDEYYLFSLSDDDFITQHGFMDGGKFPYADASGFNLDNQALVFKVKLPKGSKPL
ncbi:hypothetical protein NA57DRAFT_80961 [Rhizodiscina lignyota]|uniref:Phytase-like domain-containing protein n=1 Tax=Rhizodiscina lignyota TaxID=1504668 RepID=A0A9P4M0U3_9PEZI|nr:hypothetical protein NA57DRAFT_80961 [Rhizodiscina lignyota]